MVETMKVIFHWFYCLPISRAIVLIILATLLYLWFRKRLRKMKFGNASAAVLLGCWLLVIIFATLNQRAASIEPLEPILTPFYSYYVVFTGGERELLWENFMNAILFYPAGLLACELLPKSWSRAKRVILVAVLFALVSAGIEFCQYHFALGQAEVDDVIHNALGALIGALISTIPVKWKPGKLK